MRIEIFRTDVNVPRNPMSVLFYSVHIFAFRVDRLLFHISNKPDAVLRPGYVLFPNARFIFTFSLNLISDLKFDDKNTNPNYFHSFPPVLSSSFSITCAYRAINCADVQRQLRWQPQSRGMPCHPKRCFGFGMSFGFKSQSAAVRFSHYTSKTGRIKWPRVGCGCVCYCISKPFRVVY